MSWETNTSTLLNPCIFNLEKLGNELKCPMCMNLLNKPMLLPCDHIFCKLCVPKCRRYRVGYNECAVCWQTFRDGEPKHASYLENIVVIYKNLSHTFSTTMLLFPAGKKPRRKVSQEENNQSGDLPVNCVENGIELHKKTGKCELLEEFDVNEVPEPSPGSSRSFNIVNNASQNSDPGSSNGSTEKNSAKRSAEHHAGRVDKETFHEETFQARELKRQKKLSYSPCEAVTQTHGPSEQITNSDQAVFSNSKENKIKEDTSTELCDASNVNGSICAFCHSSKITEATGLMLHYADGEAVKKDEATFSKAIAVHSNCINWAPKVYYVGEIIKNLELELVRASKLKCCGCGLKGAALGCFAKSCQRSYHAPCAVKILDCRWDCDDFLMLCPTHKSIKFPSEKSKSRKRDSGETQPVSIKKSSEKINFWVTSHSGPQEWVFCGSALSSEEKIMVAKLAAICGATVLKSWNPNVTHVIAATDSNGTCSRTLKVLMAILNGKWILTMDWVKACLEANGPVIEESYEINMDNHGCCDGPRTGRFRASNNAPKLFDGLSFYLSGDFIPMYKSDLLDLVTVAGGTILEDMAEEVEQLVNSTNLVVYNRDIAATKDGSLSISKRLAEAKDAAVQIDALVIPHTWILESIAACRVLPYPLC